MARRKISKSEAAERVVKRWLDDARLSGDLDELEFDGFIESRHGVRVAISFNIGALDIETEQDNELATRVPPRRTKRTP